MKSDKFINKYIDNVNTYIKKLSINHTKMQIYFVNVFRVYAQVCISSFILQILNKHYLLPTTIESNSLNSTS